VSEVDMCCGTLCNPQKIKEEIEALKEEIRKRDEFISDCLYTLEAYGIHRTFDS